MKLAVGLRSDLGICGRNGRTGIAGKGKRACDIRYPVGVFDLEALISVTWLYDTTWYCVSSPLDLGGRPHDSDVAWRRIHS